MTDINIPPEVVEATARKIITLQGGDPDQMMRLTMHKMSVTQWEIIAHVVREAFRAGLNAWPEMSARPTFGPSRIILPLPQDQKEPGAFDYWPVDEDYNWGDT